MEGKMKVLPLSLPKPQGWSQLSVETLGLIFSQLERKCDLLNARLVCHSWNQECGKMLQKPESEFYQTLTERNIKEYLNFISSGGHNFPHLNLPFQLNLNIRSAEPDGPDSDSDSDQDPDSDFDPISDELYQINLNNLIENIENLNAVFGEDCVQKLTLKTVSKAYSLNNIILVKRWLVQCLKRVSRGLKILDLRDFDWSMGRYTEDEVVGWKIVELRFPKLKTLICYADYYRGTHVTHPIYEYIVEKSPHLEHLEGLDCHELLKLPVQFHQLKSLLMMSLSRNPSEILDKFRQSTLSPPLQEFRFTILFWLLTRMIDKIDILHSILDCVSGTLKSLTFTVPFDTNIVPRFLNFPTLPALQHLSVKLEVDFDDLLYLGLSITPENLPMLTSVELRLGLIFGSKFEFHAATGDEKQVPVKFTRVSHLTLCINQVYWISESGLSQGVSAMKHLLKVFPNVAKLTIKNESLGANQQNGLRNLLQSLIRSPLSQNIQEICIEGFEEDSLGQVLRLMDTLSRGQDARDIRRVRLGLCAVTHKKCGSKDPFAQTLLTVPNLTAMAKYFPTLQTIEISQLLFRGMFDEERNELIQKFTTTFPYLWVRSM